MGVLEEAIESPSLYAGFSSMLKFDYVVGAMIHKSKLAELLKAQNTRPREWLHQTAEDENNYREDSLALSTDICMMSYKADAPSVANGGFHADVCETTTKYRLYKGFLS
jgi:hypothetical protein